MSASQFTVTNPRAIREAITPGTRKASEELAGLARALTPVHLGALRSGWTVTPGRAPGAFLVTNSERHGRYVEHGTRGHAGKHMLGIAAAQIRGRYGSR